MARPRDDSLSCGTAQAYFRHRSRGETPCWEDRAAYAEYAANYMADYRAGIRRRAKEKARISDSIVDLLGTRGDAMALDLICDLVTELHPEWRAVSVRKAMDRLHRAGVVWADVRTGWDAPRWRLSESEAR